MSDLIETAKKLMTLEDFRWWDAMADTDGNRADHYDAPSMAPLDLNDPGTQGCVYAWCEEVFGDRFSLGWSSGASGTARGFNARWRDAANGAFKSHICGHPTKIEAACAALLGARQRRRDRVDGESK